MAPLAAAAAAGKGAALLLGDPRLGRAERRGGDRGRAAGGTQANSGRSSRTAREELSAAFRRGDRARGWAGVGPGAGESPPAGGGDTMNGPVFISFFQGQLESVLEQVVQLAVQEISKTVGSSLNTLLLETAVKERENRRLRLQLQSRENRSSAADGGGSPSVGKAAGLERANPEQRQPPPLLRSPGGQGTQFQALTDTRRREQRGRIVDQLRSVMEQVLDIAVCELTKIVEASFDDLLLEITKMETEHQVLEERLNKIPNSGGGGGGRRRGGSENISLSPSDSEEAHECFAEVSKSREATHREDPERPPMLSVSQDWVPILGKVFGQKWCNNIKELEGGGGGGSGRGLCEGRDQQVQDLSLTLEPTPSFPQQDPRWTPLEDMEVFSPDQDSIDNLRSNEGGASSEGGSSARRSSASMLHRLLTLPSQLVEDGGEAVATTRETLVAPATDGNDAGRDVGRPASPLTGRKEEEEEEGDDGEDKGKKKKRRRVWSECEECGRRFSRMSLLRAHRQTHITENAAINVSSPSSPPHGVTVALRCSQCGKGFSSMTRLQSHIWAQH